MAFRGWPAEALEFYEGLAADNSKTYWLEHKQTYDSAVRAPMLELLADLEPEFGAGSVFRPYRDVRFSRDKSPYKTNIGAVLDGGGYVELSAGGLAAARGMYWMSRDQLVRYRRAVLDDVAGPPLAAAVETLAAGGITLTGREVLKTAPRGVPADHPRIALLRHKGLVTWRRWPVAAWLGTAKAKDRVVGFLRASAPVQDWLDTHVGAPEG